MPKPMNFHACESIVDSFYLVTHDDPFHLRPYNPSVSKASNYE
jgi:hypothetical protein